MKKTIRIIIMTAMILLILTVFTFACADELHDTAKKQDIKTNISSLPSSLQIIDESAFEGTAINTVILPDKVITIGDYAFANIKELKKIEIPDRIAFIGENAFKGSNQVVITSSPKGYARAWAKEKGIPFAPIATFCAVENLTEASLLQGRTAQQKNIPSFEGTEKIKTRPTGRMSGELQASRYEGCSAFHIQGRSPPMV